MGFSFDMYSTIEHKILFFPEILRRKSPTVGSETLYFVGGGEIISEVQFLTIHACLVFKW